MLQFKKLRPTAIAPSRARVGDAGFDLTACIDQPITIAPAARAVVPTGVAVSCPETYVLQVWPRSGLAVRFGIDVLAGVIDSGYRNEVAVVLVNHGTDPFVINSGDRVAQLLPVCLLQTQQLKFEEVEQLDDSSRGLLGFGSSGTTGAL